MPELEEILVSVWRQTLVDGAKHIQLGADKYPVQETSRRRLKQVDFRFEDHELRGLEQNPDTESKWAAMAREGKKVMQFLDERSVRGGCGGWENEDVRLDNRLGSSLSEA